MIFGAAFDACCGTVGSGAVGVGGGLGFLRNGIGTRLIRLGLGFAERVTV